MKRKSLVLFCCLVLVLGAWRSYQAPKLAPAQFAVSATTATATNTAASTALQGLALSEVSRTDIPMPFFAIAAHASFLLQKEGTLHAFWFAGQRESGADVRIVQSTLSLTSKDAKWTAPQIVVDRHQICEGLSGQLGGIKPLNGCPIRRIGNPVAWIDGQGRTHLYVVATTYLGGWAASRILHLRQEGEAFIAKGFLPLSPFFNISHLVRAAPIPLADGGAILPIYFELGIKYPLAVRLNKDGEMVQATEAVVSMQRGLPSDWTLQPAVVAISETTAFAYLRDNTEIRRLRILKTEDAGKTWDVAPREGVTINPDSSVGALRLPSGAVALIQNPQASGRHRLVIEASADGVNAWRKLATLEYEAPQVDGVIHNEYSYPSAVLVGDKLHVSYTYQRRFIRHVVLQLTQESAP